MSNYYIFILFILMYEPDTKSLEEHKHTLTAQRRLITTDTEHFIKALG